jgi:hypothetical protein
MFFISNASWILVRDNIELRHTDRLETDPSLQTLFDGVGGAGCAHHFPQIPQIRALETRVDLDYAAISC